MILNKIAEVSRQRVMEKKLVLPLNELIIKSNNSKNEGKDAKEVIDTLVKSANMYLFQCFVRIL